MASDDEATPPRRRRRTRAEITAAARETYRLAAAIERRGDRKTQKGWEGEYGRILFAAAARGDREALRAVRYLDGLMPVRLAARRAAWAAPWAPAEASDEAPAEASDEAPAEASDEAPEPTKPAAPKPTAEEWNMDAAALAAEIVFGPQQETMPAAEVMARFADRGMWKGAVPSGERWTPAAMVARGWLLEDGRWYAPTAPVERNATDRME